MNIGKARRWNEVRKVEDAYNREKFGRMSAAESLRAFRRLYEFGSRLCPKKYLKGIDMYHIASIVKIKKMLKSLPI